MASLITDYVLKLARSFPEREKFQASMESARASMREAGLTEDQQKVLLSNDPASLAKHIQQEFGGTTIEPQAFHNTQCLVNIPVPNPPKK